MEFPYVKFEASFGTMNYRPCVPVTFHHGEKKFSVGHALVDTGSDITIVPLEIAHVLELELDDSKAIVLGSAGGGRFKALPSRSPFIHAIERKGYRTISWKGIAYFAVEQPLILLGHQHCLEKFDLTFRGPEKTLSVLPRFTI